MAYTITDVVNCSAAARRRREEALQGLALPMEGCHVRGVVPREYLRVHAEADAAPHGAAQVALCLYDEARRAGLVVSICVDEYNSPANIDIEVGGLPTLMIESRGHGCSIVLDGESGFPVNNMPYGAWAEIFEEVAASSKH